MNEWIDTGGATRKGKQATFTNLVGINGTGIVVPGRKDSKVFGRAFVRAQDRNPVAEEVQRAVAHAQDAAVQQKPDFAGNQHSSFQLPALHAPEAYLVK